MKKIGTLIKTFKGSRVTENDNRYDTLLIFYRDENGEKKTIFYDRPEIEFQTIADLTSEEAAHPPLYIEDSKVIKHVTYTDNLYRSVACATNALDYYDKIRINKGINSYDMKNIFKSPILYSADMDVEDVYIAKFYEEFDPDPEYKLHKCYFDIENDIYTFDGFPDPKIAPCEICLITLIDEKEMKSHTFILRNKKNEQLTNFEPESESFKEYMKDKIKECDSLDMTFELYFFDSELELIKAFFKKVHEIDPDYIGAWNESYDIQTLLNRMTQLLDKVKHKDATSRQMMSYYVSDEKYMTQKNSSGKTMFIDSNAWFKEGNGDIGKRTDTFKILEGINWVDQMLTYAVVHVAAGKLDSYSLDYVSGYELGKEKLPYAPGETIKNQLYKNAKKFIEYNIRDVLLLLEIEMKTGDIDVMQELSTITVTRNDKVFSKSVSIRNFINKYARTQGLYMATNKNTTYGSDSAEYDQVYGSNKEISEYDERYKKLFNKKDNYGGYVSNPLNNDYVGEEIFKGKPSKFVFNFICDEDFTALYPSQIRVFNLDARNIIGKFYLIDDETKSKIKAKYDCTNMFVGSTKKRDADDDDVFYADDSTTEDDEYTESEAPNDETQDLCSVLTDSLISKDWGAIGTLFFGLPTIDELIDTINKKTV